MNSWYPFSRVFDVNSGGIVRMTIQILKRTIVASRRRDSIGNLAARNKSTISRSIRKIPAISTKSNQMAKRFESFLEILFLNNLAKHGWDLYDSNRRWPKWRPTFGELDSKSPEWHRLFRRISVRLRTRRRCCISSRDK